MTSFWSLLTTFLSMSSSRIICSYKVFCFSSFPVFISLLILQRNPNNQMSPYEQAFGESTKENLALNRKKPPQNHAQGGAAIWQDQSGLRAGRQTNHINHVSIMMIGRPQPHLPNVGPTNRTAPSMTATSKTTIITI